jgi:hypothetical protein
MRGSSSLPKAKRGTSLDKIGAAKRLTMGMRTLRLTFGTRNDDASQTFRVPRAVIQDELSAETVPHQENSSFPSPGGGFFSR